MEIPGKKLFRCDRNKRGGGVCIYINIKLAPFCEIDKLSTFCTSDLELLTVKVKKPGLKNMIIASLYRPPHGKVQNCIDRLTEILSRRENVKNEFWVLGDYNIDFLQRANPDLLRFSAFLKRFGMSQIITSFTRPGKYRCTCIDWIVTNSPFVAECGVTDIMISDHYAIHCIKKKKKEHVEYVYCYLRNYKHYNVQNFVNLFRQKTNPGFLDIDDPNILWEHIYSTANTILEVMCPYRTENCFFM